MNRVGLFGLFVLLVVSGCGKKKESAIDSTANKKISALHKNEVPLFPSEKEELVDNSYDVGDFAFDDAEFQPVEVSLAENASNKSVPARENDIFVDEILVADAQDDAVDGIEFKRVQFDFNKNSIRNDQKLVVREDIDLAKQAVAQGKEVVVQGHTCQMGSAGYNLALSQRRAEAVKKEMVKNGIPGEAVKTVGFGYESPLVWSEKTDRNEKIKELAINRRAEVVALN